MNIVKALRIFFTLLLATAAIGKLLDIQGFYAIVANYDLLPRPIAPIVAWMLVFGEFSLAVWLGATLTGRAKPRRAALCVVLLHLVYFVWITIALARGLNISNCGCFGIYWPRPLSQATLFEDAALIALAVFMLFRSPLNGLTTAEQPPQTQLQKQPQKQPQH